MGAIEGSENRGQDLPRHSARLSGQDGGNTAYLHFAGGFIDENCRGSFTFVDGLGPSDSQNDLHSRQVRIAEFTFDHINTDDGLAFTLIGESAKVSVAACFAVT